MKFITKDALWPIGPDWFFHAGSNPGNNELLNTRKAVDRRYGPSTSAQAFSRKAQLALYEDTRAQFEDFAANGWANHKMTLYWMLNSPWPSFFGHLFDNNLKQGGAYFGAKKGLRPLSVVFDYYATGDHSHAKISIVNQTMAPLRGLQARTRIYDLLGHVRYDQRSTPLAVEAQGVTAALSLPKLANLTSTYFVRCELFSAAGEKLAENVYWQSTTPDDVGDPSNDRAFDLQQASWANLTALNTMPAVSLQLHTAPAPKDPHAVNITLHNPSSHIAFFQGVEVTRGEDGDEILPITYTDNDVTIFPGDSITLRAAFQPADLKGVQPWIRLEGYNTPKQLAAVK